MLRCCFLALLRCTLFIRPYCGFLGTFLAVSAIGALGLFAVFCFLTLLLRCLHLHFGVFIALFVAGALRLFNFYCVFVAFFGIVALGLLAICLVLTLFFICLLALLFCGFYLCFCVFITFFIACALGLLGIRCLLLDFGGISGILVGGEALGSVVSALILIIRALGGISHLPSLGSIGCRGGLPSAKVSLLLRGNLPSAKASSLLING